MPFPGLKVHCQGLWEASSCPSRIKGPGAPPGTGSRGYSQVRIPGPHLCPQHSSPKAQRRQSPALVPQQWVLRAYACCFPWPLSSALPPCSRHWLKRKFWTSGPLRPWEELDLGFLCLLPNFTTASRVSSWAAPSRKPARTSSLCYHNSSSSPAQRGEATQSGSHSRAQPGAGPPAPHCFRILLASTSPIRHMPRTAPHCTAPHTV